MCLGSVVAKPMLFPTTYMGSICELMSLVAGLGVRGLGRECLEYLVDRETRVLFWTFFFFFASLAQAFILSPQGLCTGLVPICHVRRL